MSVPVRRVAFCFDGADDYIVVPHADSMWLPEFTVAFWVKAPLMGGNRRIVEKGGYGDPEGGFSIEDWGSGYANFLVYEAGVAYGFYPLPRVILDNTWHHIAFGYRDLWIYVYIDGSLARQRDVLGYRPTSAPLVWMRRCLAPENFHSGCLADMRLYARLLTPAEVNLLYQGINITDGLVMHLSPAIPLRDDGKIQDMSGYGNHGIPYGGLRLGVYRAYRQLTPARVLEKVR